MKSILKSTPLGLTLKDERGRAMGFPTRTDYLHQLQQHGLIVDEADFVANDQLIEAVYLDWLLRPQVGCVFAQLLARPIHREGIRTVVVRGSGNSGKPSELATEIARLVQEATDDSSTEALSVLLPNVLDHQSLAELAWELGHQPRWKTEIERPWRRRVVLVGLRVEIDQDIHAEILGMGPFQTFPTTRQSPVTSLEIRTKTWRAKVSQLTQGQRAAHLADIPSGHFLTNEEFGVRFKTLTPWLKKRILGQSSDQRAKAKITFSVQAPIWNALNKQGASQVVGVD